MRLLNVLRRSGYVRSVHGANVVQELVFMEGVEAKTENKAHTFDSCPA